MRLGYQKGIDNRWYTIVHQERGSSCGPACIQMVTKYKKGHYVAESWFRSGVASAEGNPGHNWDTVGTWEMESVLKTRSKIFSARVYPSYSDPFSAFQMASKNSPAIGVVDWAGGGKHYVVVFPSSNPDHQQQGHLIVLDPWYGVQHAYRSLGYEARDQKTRKVLARGRFSNWVCTTK